MVARDVLEVDAAAVELEAVGHLLLVAGDGQRAEVRREDEAHGVRHALLGHLADDLLDPRRPVAHAEVAAEVVAELGLERVDLPPRDLEERRAPADRAVVLGDLVHDRARRGTAVADVREVAGDLVERRRPSVRHDEDADRRGARHDDVRSRTCSTSRRTLSGGVCGVSPCPTLKT